MQKKRETEHCFQGWEDQVCASKKHNSVSTNRWNHKGSVATLQVDDFLHARFLQMGEKIECCTQNLNMT